MVLPDKADNNNTRSGKKADRDYYYRVVVCVIYCYIRKEPAMFPRGVGNLEEVPQDLVLRCIEKDLQLVDKADDGHQQQQHGPKRSATTAALLVAEEQASASTSTTTTTTSSTAAAASSAAILGLFCKALRVAAQGGIGWVSEKYIIIIIIGAHRLLVGSWPVLFQK